MNRDVIEGRLKLMIQEAVTQACEAADKQISDKEVESLAARFDTLAEEVATTISGLPDRPAEQKRS